MDGESETAPTALGTGLPLSPHSRSRAGGPLESSRNTPRVPGTASHVLSLGHRSGIPGSPSLV